MDLEDFLRLWIVTDLQVSSSEMIPTWADAVGTAGPRETMFLDRSDFLRLV